MLMISKIPTLGSNTSVLPRPHRPGLWPGTMGDEFNYDDVSDAGTYGSSNVDAQVDTGSASGSSVSNVDTSGFSSGVASILDSITPQAQSGIVSAISSALGLTPKTIVVRPAGYVQPASTIPKWVWPAAGAGLLLLLIMRRKVSVHDA